VRTADNRLILGHRISEWCGHAPMLEEDIALANIALDLIGQASSFYTYYGKLEGKTEDYYAYRRDAGEFQCIPFVELPRGDFAQTIARLFLWASFDVLYLENLTSDSDQEIAGIAARSLKESKYHLRHSAEWVLRLGDGTKESHEKIQNSFNYYWPYLGGLISSNQSLKGLFFENVSKHLSKATLKTPTAELITSNNHSEFLEPLLAEMQFLPRKYPDAVW